MKYKNYVYYIDNVMKVLNGQVNKILKCHKYFYVYRENDPVYAREVNGVISINVCAIAHDLRDVDYLTRFGRIIGTISHELSHIDQDVNYFKYERDYSYRAWVEKSNELNSICFIMDNLNMLKTTIGDFNHEIFQDLYQYAKIHGTNYVAATKSKMISNIIEIYMIDTNKTRYKELDTIIMNLDGKKYIIKQRGEVIDPNILYPLVEELTNFKSIRVFNILNDPKTLIIRVQADEEQRKLEEIAYRIDKKYIV